jgi:hypothetical protein
MNGRKVNMKRAKKGASQDALGGLSAPQIAGIFAATGAQSMASATSGLRGDLGTLTPAGHDPTGLPGMTATLRGGETPYEIPALDDAYTVVNRGPVGPLMAHGATKKARKRMRKALRRALKNANNGGSLSADEMALIVGAAREANDVRSVGAPVNAKYVNKALKKAARNPGEALARLEAMTSRLKPTHPVRMSAASVVLKARLTNQAGGLIDPVEILGAQADVEQALGISGSAAPFSPGALDARSQLARIASGGQSASLRGSQDTAAITGGPAAQLGLALKSDGLGDELAAAERAVKAAEAGSDGFQLSQAHERLTLARLKAAHRAGGI